MKSVSDIFLSIFIILILSTVFIVDKNLYNGIVSGKYFWFYATITLFSVVAILAVTIKRKERLSFKLPDLLILLFCAVSVLITLHHTGRVTNKSLLLIFAMAFYFYLRIFLAGKSKLMYSLCCLAFIVTGLVEAVWGLMQLYGFAFSQHNLFKTTGSFFNPGPYSGWLAMVFPMALGYAALNYKRIFKGREVTQSLPDDVFRSSPIALISSLISSIAVLSIILILPAAMSRASWLAALGGCVFIGVIYGLRNKKATDYIKKYRKRVIFLSFVTIILLAVSMTGLFFLKKDSASGRAFIWKIALQTVKENPFGVGLGNFGGSYGDAQAAYFASGAGTEREKYVAEGVEYAFNEYLQICIETGIVPFLIFLAFVVCVLRLGVRNKNYLPAVSLVVLLIFASMSYPFNVLPFVIAFVFLSALCMVDDNDEKLKRKRFYPKFAVWTFLILVPVCVALFSSGHFQFSIFNFQFYKAYRQWNSTQMLYKMNKHSEATEEYAGLYPYLQDEIKFLFEYAQSLSKSEQYNKSNEILRRAMQISCDPMLYNIMGKNYQSLKEYELAEQNFNKAINLVPNRLYPHYLLAKLYHEMGLNDKAESETNIVLTKPPKVESMAVKEMRNELLKLRKRRK
jgi:tetratricopeptide (TPR) repeat protein